MAYHRITPEQAHRAMDDLIPFAVPTAASNPEYESARLTLRSFIAQNAPGLPSKGYAVADITREDWIILRLVRLYAGSPVRQFVYHNPDFLQSVLYLQDKYGVEVMIEASEMLAKERCLG